LIDKKFDGDFVYISLYFIGKWEFGIACMKANTKTALRGGILVILYVLLGNARSIQENPVIPGAVIAVSMIIPVLAGILFGRNVGLSVGLIGTVLNAVSPAGSLFEFTSIVPHGVMGFCAGLIKEKFPTLIAAGSIIIGHLLNIFMFGIFGLLDIELLYRFNFWFGIASESLIEILAVIVLTVVYKLGFSGIKYGSDNKH
jgi:uncharacterized membrane protein